VTDGLMIFCIFIRNQIRAGWAEFAADGARRFYWIVLSLHVVL